MTDDELDPLVGHADLDGLVRLIDSRCASRDWEGLLRVRDRSRHALETGRQLWPAATLAEYRLALLAPPEWATRVLDEDSGRFTVGPLTEVIAQNNTWADLRDLLPLGPRRSFVAYERALRGESIDPHELDGLDLALDIPLTRQDWEPDYPLPVYSDDGILAPSPADHWRHDWTVAPRGSNDAARIHDTDVDEALRSLVDPWTSSSNGRAETLVVEGTPADALHILGIPGGRLAPISVEQALSWLAWCGSSGGAHGRRRGGALGRFGVWWTLAALGGFADEWDDLCRAGSLSDECADTARSFSWYRFDDGSTGGYELSLVAGEPDDDSTIAQSIVLLARDSA